jgi:hypothetical protein
MNHLISKCCLSLGYGALHWISLHKFRLGIREFRPRYFARLDSVKVAFWVVTSYCFVGG